ncbi:unnamed protein product, partial [Mesorhabditis belari]|uniref:Thioredoxin domain-containing protein n=1 Tax=Mesorhabditis belari TaxID=2138241 RepID=A0AAF3FGH1_9BILA
MAQLLADVELVKNDGSKHNASELEGKVVGLYFSAHWCPPCRQFTPVLKDFYNDLAEEGDFEIVFVSFDRSAEDLKKYLDEAHGDWFHIAYGNPKIQELATKLQVSGIPAFIIVKPNGDVITKEGRSEVSSKAPKQALSGWKKSL